MPQNSKGFSLTRDIAAAFLVLYFALDLGLDFKQFFTGFAIQNPHQGGIDLNNIRMTDLKTGTGPSLKSKSKIIVNYKTWLFDSRNQEQKGELVQQATKAELIWGDQQLIESWEKALVGLSPGGVRRFIFSADQGYKDHGAGKKIPPGAKLITEVELLDLMSAKN